MIFFFIKDFIKELKDIHPFLFRIRSTPEYRFSVIVAIFMCKTGLFSGINFSLIKSDLFILSNSFLNFT